MHLGQISTYEILKLKIRQNLLGINFLIRGRRLEKWHFIIKKGLFSEKHPIEKNIVKKGTSYEQKGNY